MKLVKIVGGVAAAVLLVFVIGGAVLPKDFEVERSIVVDAPPAVAFAEINDLRGWEAWSPWQKRDPTMKITYGAACRRDKMAFRERELAPPSAWGVIGRVQRPRTRRVGAEPRISRENERHFRGSGAGVRSAASDISSAARSRGPLDV